MDHMGSVRVPERHVADAISLGQWSGASIGSGAVGTFPEFGPHGSSHARLAEGMEERRWPSTP